MLDPDNTYFPEPQEIEAHALAFAHMMFEHAAFEREVREPDVFEGHIANPLMQGTSRMAHFILAVAFERGRYCGLDDLTSGRPQLAKWMRSMSDLPSMRRTAPP
jgi:hypothetical protein